MISSLDMLRGGLRAPAPAAEPGPKVIVVDDDREAREFIRELLEPRGFRVVEAQSGLRLISYLHVDRPDLILLDVRMSWISGLELCRAIKRNPEFQDIPVCFISALAEPEDVREGLRCGAAAYFVKPIDTDELLRTLAQLAHSPATRHH